MLAALMYVKSQGIEETDKAKFQDLLNLVSIDSVDEDSSDGESNNQVSFVDSRPEHKNSKISDEWRSEIFLFFLEFCLHTLSGRHI